MHDFPHGSALYCELVAPGDTTAKTYERHGWQIREGHTGHAHHHTITAGEVSLLDAAACRRLIDATAALLADYLATARRILVVGLGNAALTADRLGPAVCGKLTLAGQAPVGRTLYSFVPGVPAVTGIPTDRLVTLAAHAIQAEQILAVDALCARSAAMLGQVVQLSDGGLVPGSGGTIGCSSVPGDRRPHHALSRGHSRGPHRDPHHTAGGRTDTVSGHHRRHRPHGGALEQHPCLCHHEGGNAGSGWEIGSGTRIGGFWYAYA